MISRNYDYFLLLLFLLNSRKIWGVDSGNLGFVVLNMHHMFWAFKHTLWKASAH